MKAMNIQLGHVARHTPRNSGAQGREAAVIDISQDLLLAHLHEEGLLGLVVIKGGTAIRKLYAGNEGRFSLDLDFAVRDVGQDRELTALELVSEVDGLTLGPFTYGIEERRGKFYITQRSRFVEGPTLPTKLDFASPPWIKPVRRAWVPMPIHSQYGRELPEIETVALEENLAEKIARLNRVTTARDMYDPAWVASSPATYAAVSLPLVRRLAVLKIWVDTNGMHAGQTHWQLAHHGSVFDAGRWLRVRDTREFDLEDIGALAVPTPSSEELGEVVRRGYAFLADMDDDERVVARSDERDRSLAIRMLGDLPGGRLRNAGLY